MPRMTATPSKDCVTSGEIKGGKVGPKPLSTDDCCLPKTLPKNAPLAAVSSLKNEKPGRNFSLPGVILLYEDLYTDVFPVFWSLIIAFLGPKSLCMGIIDYETEVKLIPLYF